MEKLRRKYLTFVANNFFLDKGIDYDIYTRDYYIYVKEQYPHFSPLGILKKDLFFDMDGVFNSYRSEEPSSSFFKRLGEINQRIGKNLPTIFSILSNFSSKAKRLGEYIFKNKIFNLSSEVIRKIPFATSLQKELSRLSEQLRKARVRKEECLGAAKLAVQSVRFVDYLYEGLAEIEKLGFRIHLHTYSPEAVALAVGEELEILPSRIKPTRFIFNKGEFRSLVPLSEMWKKIDREKKDAVFVTDDWKSDAGIAAALDLGLLVLTDDKEGFPEDRIYIYLPELRKDFRELPKAIRKYEWARLYSFFVKPSSLKRAIILAKEIERDARRCGEAEKEYEIFLYGKSVEEKTKALLELLRPVFPEKSYGMDELLKEAETYGRKREKERYKKVIEDIRNRIGRTPLPKAREKFVEGLEDLIKELEGEGIELSRAEK